MERIRNVVRSRRWNSRKDLVERVGQSFRKWFELMEGMDEERFNKKICIEERLTRSEEGQTKNID